MGRNFYALQTNKNNNDQPQLQSHGREQSPGRAVIAVAVAAHHMLVTMAEGYDLMAFGLEKDGGRLGVGDEGHHHIPTHVLGRPLEHRKVVSIAAALDQSLCVTSDGDIFSCGSNRFNQLGISSSSSSGGKNAKPGAINLMQIQMIHRQALAIQVPMVGWTHLRSMEQLGPCAVFLGFQLLEYCEISRDVTSFLRNRHGSFSSKWQVASGKWQVASGVLVLVLDALLGHAFTPKTYFGPFHPKIDALKNLTHNTAVFMESKQSSRKQHDG
eukprot:scaffold57597_cov55-Attheya_sp.AAC.3